MIIRARQFMRQRHMLDDQSLTDVFKIEANLNCCCGLGTKLNYCLCSDLNQKDLTTRQQNILKS